MSTSAYDSTMTNSRDLESLRTRLWRLSSMLTCGVLAVALVGTWVANAVVMANSNRSILLNVLGQAVTPGDLMWAQEHADARVDYALDDRYRENAKQGQDQGQFPWPYGTASDSAAASGPIPADSFRVAVFDDGGVAFLDSGQYVMSYEDTVSLVERAIDVRADGGPKMPEQISKVSGSTWLWTTQISATNPVYDPADPESSVITLYASGDLSDYGNDGLVAARVFAFVDITPSVTQLKWLALVLGVAGVAGCAVLVLVCRKIIDRALVPVAESQARQREFLIKASHELKTPMASLSSNLDALVANSAETVASQERWTKNMREDIDELADHTCKLLDLVAGPGMRMRCGRGAAAFALPRRADIASRWHESHEWDPKFVTLDMFR